MRFGISPLTYDLLIDGILAKKGLEGLSEFRLSDVAKRAAMSGYQHFEIQLDLFQIFPITMDRNEIKLLREIKNEFGITYSTHLPFLSVDLGGPNKFVREGSVNSLIDAYNSVVELVDDIDVHVLHPTGETVADFFRDWRHRELATTITSPQIREITTELFSANTIQSIERFVEETNIERSKIALENIEFPFETTIKIIKKLKTKLCLDTAHVLGGFSGNHDLLEITNKYLDITAEIHLQDFDGENPLSDHTALGNGTFPPEFLNLIHKKNFGGPVVFELPKDDVIQSIKYIRKNSPQVKIPDIKDQSFLERI